MSKNKTPHINCISCMNIILWILTIKANFITDKILLQKSEPNCKKMEK